MARTMTTASLGRVNRRLLLFALILAVLSAILVYTATSRSGEGGSVAGGIPVVVAKEPINAGTRITAVMLEVQQVPASAVGFQPLTSIDAAVGNVARYPIATNEQVLLSKIVGSSVATSSNVLVNVLEDGTRALAIQTSRVVGAGGLVLPGDHVDILWVPDEVEDDHSGAMLLAENIEVLAVQETLIDIAPAPAGVEDGDEQAVPGTTGDRVRGVDAEAVPDASTVTLMVTLSEATRIFCAEHTGSLRLAVRGFGDTAPTGLPPANCVIRANDTN